MIKSELVRRIASQNPHLYQRDIEKIVSAILDEIAEALRRGDPTPATRTAFFVAAAAATPTIKLAVERMPSLAPSTAARSHPIRSTR